MEESEAWVSKAKISSISEGNSFIQDLAYFIYQFDFSTVLVTSQKAPCSQLKQEF